MQNARYDPDTDRASRRDARLDGSARSSRSRVVLAASDIRATVARLVALALAFAALSAWVWHRHGPTSLDNRLLHGYNVSKASTVFDAADTMTILGSPGVVVALAVALAVLIRVRFRSLPWALACVAAPAIAAVTETALKAIIARPRPATAILVAETGNGFPSGHASGFAAFAFIVAFAVSRLYRRPAVPLLLVAFVASAVMAATRVLVGAHYPTDVLAGMVLGLGVAEVVALIARSVADSPSIRPQRRAEGERW